MGHITYSKLITQLQCICSGEPLPFEKWQNSRELSDVCPPNSQDLWARIKIFQGKTPQVGLDHIFKGQPSTPNQTWLIIENDWPTLDLNNFWTKWDILKIPVGGTSWDSWLLDSKIWDLDLDRSWPQSRFPERPSIFVILLHKSPPYVVNFDRSVRPLDASGLWNLFIDLLVLVCHLFLSKLDLCRTSINRDTKNVNISVNNGRTDL